MPKQLTTTEYIAHAKLIHLDKYEYEKTQYKNAHTKVTITCKLHGDFSMKATNHTLQKQGCPQCAGNIKYTTEEFIKKANIIHNNFYSYGETCYTTSHNLVTITCPVHGNFEQQAYVHLQQHGCPNCALDKVKLLKLNSPDLWSYTNWEKAGLNSKHFINLIISVINWLSVYINLKNL